ncbi:microtubule-associated protein 70-2-like isoform X2 [Magnolia sinica]|uniref:microtubule-associated protein 70-2-like isoform X2 n=1 Tax=Magnolia sinica TaxID=86752 RepID=UPI0026593887|nr:microtubule-associated protein 70-2-like isoform X2 [Magnolia sinica]
MAENRRKIDLFPPSLESSELGFGRSIFGAGSMAENHDPREFGSELDLSGRSIAASASFRAEIKTAAAKKKYPKRSSLDEEDFMNFLHGSDPVKIELNRLQNDVRDKDRELAEAHNEIRALRLTERAKEKALAEVTEELGKMVEKFQASEAALENKNLEIKKISDEKKAALAAQFAAEATLRRVHAAQKDEELPPLEAILAPLEAEIKLLRQEVSKLQDDNRALERLTKSKEAALLDAEREVHLAKIKASLVDDLQNRNQELMKQIEISQEEYKILDKMHRQKVAEVEKLGQTVHELEEALLSGAAAANAVRDYQRQVNELMGEKKMLERTLSRARVTENRVAVVVANEWKDANDKVMPVKQWLEERRFLMGEMQQLRDKLSIAERTAKTEAQLKEKFQLRLKVVEDGLKSSIFSGNRSSELRSTYNGTPRRQSVGGAEISSRILSSGISMRKSSASLVRSLTMSSSSSAIMRHAKGASRSFDAGRSLDEDQCSLKSFGEVSDNNCMRDEIDGLSSSSASVDTDKACIDGKQSDHEDALPDDFVSGIFYDILQKEVIALRKACHEKDQSLKDQDNAIEMLSKKVDTLTKALEVEAKKSRREKAAMEKEVASLRIDKEHEQKARRLPSSKGLINNLHMPSGSSIFLAET